MNNIIGVFILVILWGIMMIGWMLIIDVATLNHSLHRISNSLETIAIAQKEAR